MLLESFEKVYDDPRISEIVISDDHSDREIYYQLESVLSAFPKVKLFRNDFNMDCYKNKRQAVELCTNEWVILLDSDNIINKDYLDRIYEAWKWDEDTIYTPSWAMPHFDFRAYSGHLYSKETIQSIINKPMGETMLNAANYFVNRNQYLKVWENGVDPVTSDSIFHCYNWLKNGNKIMVVPNLHYQHRVHDGSHYKNNVARTPNGFHESILMKLKELK